ncbi:MAG: Hint domain-containing protein [Albidovulum sp.]|uniref:Hint domain-containing protein n=1 Tax=Albidovulum sp. TaxID=1872424 RepID=UPI003CA6F5E6
MSYHQYNAVSSAEIVSISVPKNTDTERRIPGKPAVNRSPAPLNRRFEIAYLDAQGQVDYATRLAPAVPEIENAFCALARGSVIATTEGPVAIEDIVPGMVAHTAEGREETITWIGSMTLFPPNAMPGMTPRRLVRVTGDAFGVGRPMPDLILGPSARLLIRNMSGNNSALSSAYGPASSFVDGVSVIEVAPVTPVTVFHVMLERHGSLRVAGLEIESVHPGAKLQERLGPELSQRFLSLFPHLQNFSEFGVTAHPRLTANEVEAALAS